LIQYTQSESPLHFFSKSRQNLLKKNVRNPVIIFDNGAASNRSHTQNLTIQNKFPTQAANLRTLITYYFKLYNR